MEKKFICHLCEPHSELRQCKIEWHLSKMHGTQSSWKCSKCSFPGTKETILVHIRDTHDSKGKVVKSIRAKLDSNVPLVISDSETYSSLHNDDTSRNQKLNNSFKKVENSNLLNNHRQSCQPLRVSNFSDIHYSSTSPNDENSFHFLNKSENVPEENNSKVISSSENLIQSSLSTSMLPSSLSSSASSAIPYYPVLPHKFEDERTSNIYFCIFCNNVETKFSPALSHYKRHLKFGFRCRNEKSFVTSNRSDIDKHCRKKHNKRTCKVLDDLIQRPFVENWIIDFLNEQFLGARFQEHSDDKELTEAHYEEQVYVHCPICVMVTKYNNKLPIKYTSFREFERHFWIHCRWMRVDCIICGAPTLRSKQRDHLLSHNLQDTCYHEFYMERSDKIIANLLQKVVDQVETLYDKRLAWTFEIRKELLIVLDDVNLNYDSDTEIDLGIENACSSIKDQSEYEGEAALRKAVEILGGKKEDLEAILNGTLKEEFSNWQKEINLKYDQYIQDQIKYETEKNKMKNSKKKIVDNEKVGTDIDLYHTVKLEKMASWKENDDSNDIVVVANLDLSSRAS